jgi:hypothetical protein
MHSRSNGQFSVVSAGTIIANIFQLIDGAGNVVGELGQRVIGVNTSPALLMNHGPGGPAASYLGWRYAGLGITYSVVLSGPGAGARLTLSNNGAASDGSLFAQNTLTVSAAGTLNLDGATVNLASLYNVLQGGYPLVGVHAGLAAARPGSGGGAPPATAGSIYYATDTQTLSQYDGTGWVILSEPPQSWAYPFTNGTLGNGSWSGNYKRGDGWLDFEGIWILGTTSTIAGVPLSITLPQNRAENAMIGGMTLHLWDVSIGEVNIGVIGAGNSPVLLGTDSNAVYLRVTNISPTVPFTWANGDRVSFSGRYRMASRYS